MAKLWPGGCFEWFIVIVYSSNVCSNVIMDIHGKVCHFANIESNVLNAVCCPQDPSFEFDDLSPSPHLPSLRRAHERERELELQRARIKALLGDL